MLYAMEHADRIFAGIVLSFDLERDLLVGVTVAVVLKLLVWQKQSDAKKLRKEIGYWFARWGNAEDMEPLYVGRSMDEHSPDSNRSIDHGKQTETAEIRKK